MPYLPRWLLSPQPLGLGPSPPKWDRVECSNGWELYSSWCTTQIIQSTPLESSSTFKFAGQSSTSDGKEQCSAAQRTEEVEFLYQSSKQVLGNWTSAIQREIRDVVACDEHGREKREPWIFSTKCRANEPSEIQPRSGVGVFTCPL